MRLTHPPQIKAGKFIRPFWKQWAGWRENNALVNIRNLEAGNAIRIVKKFRDCNGTEFEAGRILHFTRRDYLPYHSGHTVYFREATMYLCDDDATSAVVQNGGGEYYALIETGG